MPAVLPKLMSRTVCPRRACHTRLPVLHRPISRAGISGKVICRFLLYSAVPAVSRSMGDAAEYPVVLGSPQVFCREPSEKRFSRSGGFYQVLHPYKGQIYAWTLKVENKGIRTNVSGFPGYCRLFPWYSSGWRGPHVPKDLGFGPYTMPCPPDRWPCHPCICALLSLILGADRC